MTVTIERVFELTDNDIEHLAKRWQCQFDEVKEIIESGDFDIKELHFFATKTHHDRSTVRVK